MEHFNPLSPENEEKPEKKGESSELKKKRRKTLLVQKPEKVGTKLPDLEKEAKEKPKTAPEAEPSVDSPAQEERSQEEVKVASTSETDIQPEIPESNEVELDEEFLGELVIDHSDEDDFHDHLPQEPVAPEVELPVFDIEGEPVATAPNFTTETVYEQPIMTSAEYVAPEEPVGPSIGESFPAQPPIEAVTAAAAAAEVARSYEVSSRDKEASAESRTFDSFAPENPFVGNFGMVNPNSESKKPERVEPVVTEKESNKRAYRAEKRGLSRGVLTGGIVGWLVGRRGKRAAERQATMAIENRDETIKKLAAERDLQRNLSTSRLGIIERTQGEMRSLLQKSRDERERLSQRVEELTKTREKQPSRSPESAAPVFDTLPKPEKIAPKEAAAKPTVEADQDKDQYQAPENHKFELSAWHRIEVDKATGRAVEAPTSNYGEAFVREQKQEKLAREAATAQTAAHLGMALFSGGTQPVPVPSSDPSSQTPGNQHQGRVTKDSSYLAKQLVQRTTSPATWVIALTIVAILFLIGIIS